MHAARPYEYFEDAFLAWLDRECGGYETLRAGGHDFVIVESRCRYLEPARLGDRIDLVVRPGSVGRRSSFSIEIDMARETRVLAQGSVTYVTVREGRSSQIPDRLRQALRVACLCPCRAVGAAEHGGQHIGHRLGRGTAGTGGAPGDVPVGADEGRAVRADAVGGLEAAAGVGETAA